MTRSSFSDNPLLRVSRPVSACSRCRAAKVKCDGKLPACTACEKAGRENECSSANDQFARGKERSYVAALELRTEKLERRLAFAKSRKESVSLHEPDELRTHYDRKDSLDKIRAAIHRKAARKREDSDINSLLSDFGFLSVDATSRDFEPTDVNNMTFGRFVLSACTNDDLPDSTTTDKALPLPPRHEAHAVVQHYMTNVYALYPCFSQTKLFTVLNDLYQQDSRVIQDADHWLAYMVLAVGFASQSRCRGDPSYRKAVDFASRALPYADGALAPGYVTQIQSLILLTQYSMVDPAHFDSWYLIGFVTRAVIDLGFHQDPSQGQVGDMVALDMRRSIFYCVYSLDRSISMAHARAFSFSDDSINVSYPTSTPGRRNSSRRESTISSAGPLQSPITGPQDADPALSLFELRRKQSNWYQTLFQSEPTPLQDATGFVWQMCLEMHDWNESLPLSLPGPVREHLDLELRYSYVYCLAPSSRAPQLTEYARALIFEHALAYAAAVHAVAHRVDADALALYTYHDVLKVYFVATQFVTVLNDGSAAAGAGPGAGAGACSAGTGTGADALLAGVTPPVPFTRPGTAPPPPLPRRNHEDNVTRSLRCLHHVVETLQKLGERWDNALPLKESFDAMSGDLWGWLKARKQMMESAPTPPQVQVQQHSTPTPPPQQQQQQQQQQQHLHHRHHHHQLGVVGTGSPGPGMQPPGQQQYRWV